MEKNIESNAKIEKEEKSEKKTGLLINLLKKIDKTFDDTLKYTFM